MYELRLDPTSLSEGRFIVRLELLRDENVVERDETTVVPTLSPQDLEDLRWYLEDFPAFPVEPAVKIAELVERRSTDAGIDLFHALFDSTTGGRRIWSTIGPSLDRSLIVVGLNSPSVDSFPWELVRESNATAPLAVLARAFVRRLHGAPPMGGEQSAGAIRVLIAICRPDAQSDVPFRSVAGRLLAAPEVTRRLDFRVLRPPSFDQLRTVLRDASAAGKPFHVVHFDGHGIYEDLFGGSDAAKARNRRGYLIFEDVAASDNRAYVHGTKLGRELSLHGVGLLVLNACRSAHASVMASPPSSDAAMSPTVQAYGSLAAEVVRAGVASVVAMRYNVWVDSAAQFMTEMYIGLAESGSLGESVRRARTKLFSHDFREHARRALQDWQVPVVYEQKPMRVINQESATSGEPRLGDRAAQLTAGLPPPPPAGFAGHDGAILAIDRGFDGHDAILLIGAAGAGKSSVISEFGRWLALTGGSAEPLLHTSFRDCRSVEQVIDSAIVSMGTCPADWRSLDLALKRSELLAYLRRSRSFWLWDELDLATGSILGRHATWRAAEQRGLKNLLHDVLATRTRLLLGSRAAETDFVGPGVARISLPPLPMSDRYEILRRLAVHIGKPLGSLDGWEPLLQLSEGNTLALIALAESAFNTGSEPDASVCALLDRIYGGAPIGAGQCSSASLRAIEAELCSALQCFTPAEQRQLVLLALFRGVFTETTLRYMGRTDRAWCLEELSDISAMTLMSLLDRFAQSGLLRPLAGGYFLPHPLLSILLRPRLDRMYASDVLRPLRAFAGVMGAMCTYMVQEYNRGAKTLAEALVYERANVSYALHVAFQNEWSDCIVALMQGLRLASMAKGIDPEWPLLVDRATPLFVLPDSEGPVRGREDDWSLVMEYRIGVAQARNDLSGAERLEEAHTRWLRSLAIEAAASGDRDRASYRQARLAQSLRRLADMRARSSRAECLPAYEEAFELMTQLGRRRDCGLCARDLAMAYGFDAPYADPERFEYWAKRTIELIPDDAEAMGLLQALRTRQGAIWAINRAEQREKIAADPSEQSAGGTDDLIEQLMSLHKMFNELPLPPSSDPGQRMGALWTRGELRLEAGDSRGLNDYLEALQIAADLNDALASGQIELSLARKLVGSGRVQHGVQYATAALQHFLRAGERGAAGAVEARELLLRSEQQPDWEGPSA